MTHSKWLQIAERLDVLRVFPRLFMLFFTCLTGYVVLDLIEWYKYLPSAERQLEASGFAFGVIGALSGLWTACAKIYVESGRRWKVDILDASPE